MSFSKKPFKVLFVKYFPFLLVILGNLWIWRMFKDNPFIGISAFLASWLLYRSLKEEKMEKLLVVFVLILIVFQIKNTQIRSLTFLNEAEGVVQLQRLNEYPPVKVTVGAKTVWVPLAHWLEGRPETLALYRIQNNLAEVVNPNLYFFANHPNERVGIKEHESFPYILLPFFAVGLLGLNFRKNLAAFFVSLLAPITLVALVGSQIAAEPISLFPFVSISSVYGLEYIGERVEKLKSNKLKRIVIISFIFLYLLILLQTYLYDRS